MLGQVIQQCRKNNFLVQYIFMARIEDRVETVGNASIRLSDEMRSFKDEMRVFRDEMRVDRRESNKQWGALSNKLGTIVEDLIAPAVRPAVKTYFGVEPFSLGIHYENVRMVRITSSMSLLSPIRWCLL